MQPFIEVSHLAPSASFFSAVVQPLGLRYLYADERPNLLSSPSASTVTFGYGFTQPAVPVFEVREVRPGQPLRPCHITFSAASPQAVAEFHRCALRANPALAAAGPDQQYLYSSGVGADFYGGEVKAKIVDLDGNSMDVIYLPPSHYPRGYNGDTIRRTQSSVDEASRILGWNLDVARSEMHGPSALQSPRSAGRYPENDRVVLRRSITSSAVETAPPVRVPDATAGWSAALGIAAGVGVGLATGAALTYQALKQDRARAPRQEYEPQPGNLPRRSTFPDPPYHHDPRGSSRYADLERGVEKVRLADEYGTAPLSPDRHPAPHYSPRYGSQAGGASAVDGHRRSPPRMREIEPPPSTVVADDYEAERSRHAERFSRRGSGGGGGSSVRTRSEAQGVPSRRPLLLADHEHRSYSGSGSPGSGIPESLRYAQPLVAPISMAPRRQGSYEPPPPPPPPPASVLERDSYVSARSHRSGATTVRPPPQLAPRHSSVVAPSQAHAQPQYVTTSHAGRSRAATTIKMAGSSGAAPIAATAGPAPSARSGSRSGSGHRHSPSYVSARNVPLPVSRVGSSHATGWPEEMVAGRKPTAGASDEEDADSVAPSDSISCVGSRRRNRAYY